MNLNGQARSVAKCAYPALPVAFVSLDPKSIAMRPLVDLIIWSSREGRE
jgi:hypothetical protein